MDVAGNPASVVVGNVNVDKINVDKTPPEAYLSFHVPTFDIALYGRDALSTVPAGPLTPSASVKTTWPGAIDPMISSTLAALRLTYDVTDLAGNVTHYVALVQRHSHSDTEPGTHASRGALLQWQYGAGAVVAAPSNNVQFEWRNSDARIFNRLIETMKITNVQRVTAKWVAGTNTTQITVAVPLPQQVFTLPGLSLLRLATNAGTLKVEFDVP